MKRKALLIGGLALTLLLWRLLARRRGRGSAASGEKPGWGYAIERLRGIASPPVEITAPP